ncbi:MAG TPA: ABC transporter permease subunit [Mycobacteriales bacterium]|nr:ABC transporter permease subunit [Mycobacteriales bacterium]
MSSADAAVAVRGGGAAVTPRVHSGALGRQLRSELRLAFGRRRNQILLVALGAIPLAIGIAVKLSPPGGRGGDGPQFLNRITDSGLFLVLTALFIMLNLFLPVVIGIVSADGIAGEAQAGTLRYLLTVPVRRGRLLFVKAFGLVTYALAAVGTIAMVAAIAGMALFGTGSFTLLGGQTVSTGEGLLRILAVAIYVWLSLFGLIAVGLLISVLTEVPIAAMAATLGFGVLSIVLDQIPQLHAIHPGLIDNYWQSFGTLIRVGPDFGQLGRYLLLQLVYVAVAGGLAWAKFSDADVTS